MKQTCNLVGFDPVIFEMSKKLFILVTKTVQCTAEIR